LSTGWVSLSLAAPGKSLEGRCCSGPGLYHDDPFWRSTDHLISITASDKLEEVVVVISHTVRVAVASQGTIFGCSNISIMFKVIGSHKAHLNRVW